MACGLLNSARDKVSSANPAEPDPAIVVVIPSTLMRRIRLFPESETYTTPAESTVTPAGWCRKALSLRPSLNPGMPEPARLVTIPSGWQTSSYASFKEETWKSTRASVTNVLVCCRRDTIPFPSCPQDEPARESVLRDCQERIKKREEQGRRHCHTCTQLRLENFRDLGVLPARGCGRCAEFSPF